MNGVHQFCYGALIREGDLNIVDYLHIMNNIGKRIYRNNGHETYFVMYMT